LTPSRVGVRFPLRDEDARRAIAYLEEALAFEDEAVRRYSRHIASISHPRVNALLEGVMRTEKRHMAELREKIKTLRRQLREEG